MPRRVTHKFGKHMKAVTAGFGGHYAMEACGCCKTYRAKLLDCSGSELKSGEWETSKAAAEQSLFDKLATVAYGLLAGEWEFPREKA